MHAFIS